MKVVSVNISHDKGMKKESVPSARLKVGHGLEGDAHAGDWHRQVSLLAQESIDRMKNEISRAKLGGLELSPGDFAENITTEGLDLLSLKIGTRIKIGSEAVMEMTQIGKECHSGCAIMKAVGKCVMPTEGVFFIVIVPGEIKPGDEISIL